MQPAGLCPSQFASSLGSQNVPHLEISWREAIQKKIRFIVEQGGNAWKVEFRHYAHADSEMRAPSL